MNWEALNIIGTAAFAISGAIVAREAEYDLVGIFVLGLVTAFAGGIIKNVLIGIPPSVLWQQDTLLITGLAAVTATILLPGRWVVQWQRRGTLFDALGLAAFAIQAASQARSLALPLGAVAVAAVLTGVGGGIVRDVLAGRKPLVFRDEIYALWALLAGIVVWLGWAASGAGTIVLLLAVVALRLAAVRWHWHLPRRTIPTILSNPPVPGAAREEHISAHNGSSRDVIS